MTTLLLTYEDIRTTDEFADFMKLLYFPKPDEPEELDVPRMKFLSIIGKGSPESDTFQQYIQAMYGMAFGLKMGLSHGKLPQPDSYYDYRMPPPGGLVVAR